MRPSALAAPPPVPRRTGRLAVGEGHVLAWQEFGPPDGLPALVLHGGPGSALTPTLVGFFDLARWRVVGFDQRGCGASTPRGAIAGNDTARLLRDTEALRLHLDVPRWFVAGGSWGATLGLAYAAHAPQAVSGLLLRALFVPEPQELQWFFHGAREIAPQVWEALAGLAPQEARGDLVPWLAEVFARGEPSLQSRVALAWAEWEQALATREQDALGSRLRGNDEERRGRCRIEPQDLTTTPHPREGGDPGHCGGGPDALGSRLRGSDEERGDRCRIEPRDLTSTRHPREGGEPGHCGGGPDAVGSRLRGSDEERGGRCRIEPQDLTTTRHPREGGDPGHCGGGPDAVGSRLRGSDEEQMARYRIQSHYLAHGCWLGHGELRDAARSIAGIPVHFLHGEQDLVCRPAAAQSIQRLIPGSTFEPVPRAGHDPLHPAMVAAMQAALDAASRERQPA